MYESVCILHRANDNDTLSTRLLEGAGMYDDEDNDGKFPGEA
jgi:hypothetical protein